MVDGRNRLDAMELAGVPIFKAGNKPNFDNFDNFYNVELESDAEIRAYVISANIHRRHLDPGQRIGLLRELVKADPTKSSRQIAKAVQGVVDELSKLSAAIDWLRASIKDIDRPAGETERKVH